MRISSQKSFANERGMRREASRAKRSGEAGRRTGRPGTRGRLDGNDDADERIERVAWPSCGGDHRRRLWQKRGAAAASAQCAHGGFGALDVSPDSGALPPPWQMTRPGSPALVEATAN